MNKLTTPLLAMALGSLLLTGCATSKKLPAAYLSTPHELSVDISRIPPKAQMRDSGQGGLIGVLVNATRSSVMKERMAGIQGETVKELLRQEITKRLEEKFTITESNQDLRLEIQITTWGWFAPSTALGIRTGAYQLEIIGIVMVHDVRLNKKQVAFIPLAVQKPLGSKPGEEISKEMLLAAVPEFAEKVADFILN